MASRLPTELAVDARMPLSAPRPRFQVRHEPHGIHIGDWEITVKKSHILKAADAERLSTELGLPLPEMVFGHNALELSNRNGFAFSINAIDALRLVDNAHDLIKVVYSTQWSASRETVQPYDWTFSTDYSGTIVNPVNGQGAEDTDLTIDYELLKRPDPILFYDELTLFEDELADNGAAQLTARVRCMPGSFFVLLRFLMRVDGVVYRIIDTRLWHIFGTDFVLREHLTKEAAAPTIEKLVASEGDKSQLADANWLNDRLPIVRTRTEKIFVGPTTVPDQERPS